jgi:hypothetical protein
MLGAKISIVLLYRRIAPQQARSGVLFLYGCIAVWAVFAILAQSFQCGGSVEFKPDQCLSGRLQYPSITLNIITDALLSFWMAPQIWKLQSSTESLRMLRGYRTAYRLCVQHRQRRPDLGASHSIHNKYVSSPARCLFVVVDLG